MIRLTWLQSRTQTLVAATGLGIAAALVAATGPHLVHLYDDIVRGCAVHNDCDVARNVFLRHDATLRGWLDALVVAVPGIVGVFWGAPLVARELESGTHRLVWAQSVSRRRWLTVKLSVVGLASIATAGLLSLAVTAWASPLDHAHMARYDTFDMRDVVPIAYAAFAFALAVTAGLLIRRTIPAMASALVAFAATRVAVLHWVRPDLAALTHIVLPLTNAHHVGFLKTPAGAALVAGDPSIHDGLIVSSRIADRGGHPVSAQTLHHVVQTACPALMARVGHPIGSQGPPDPRLFGECVQRISTKLDLTVAYQPGSHYWQIQWAEAAIFVVAALALAAFCLWRVRRHV